MKTLQEAYEKTQQNTKFGDKGTVHTYIDIYESYLKKFKHKCNLLELGCAYGESLLMWEDYIQSGLVLGIQREIHPKLAENIKKYELNVVDASCTDPRLPELLKDLNFDIIVDDASHLIEDQILAFNNLKHLVTAGGFYIIEDIQNLDKDREKLEKLHSNFTIYDNRHLKDRYDDVLVVYEF